MRTKEELDKLFEEAVNDMKAAGISPPMERLTKLEYNARFSRAWGKCRYHHLDFGLYRCEIRLSEKLCQLGTDDAIRQVAAHELIHLCHPGEGHGFAFKEEAGKLNRAFPERYQIERCTPAAKVAGDGDTDKLFKYIVQCPKCGYKWGYDRNCQTVRFPATYRCRKCKCGLERVK